jgi:ABC-type multidrug transport system ATPase subunit
MVFGLLGPNGAGKTTLIRILATLLVPDSGRAELLGHDVVADPASARELLALTGQFAAVDELLTGRENLEMFGRLFRLSRAQASRRASELLERFELVDAADRTAKTYSGGMRRRLDLASSLLTQPRVLFLDEPTTGLDPQSRRAIWDMFGELRAHEPDLAIILTTHAMEEADFLCDRVAILDQGRILCENSPAALKHELETGEKVELEADHEITDEDELSIASAGATNLRFVSPMRVHFDARPGQGVGRRAARLLEDRGYHIVHLKIALVTLEDVFFSYTGRALRDA